MPSSNYAVAVILTTSKGVVLVRDATKPLPHFWKFPGGRSQSGEAPAQTAVRELQEETSIELKESDLTLLLREQRASHEFFAFSASLSDAPELHSSATSGEEVCYVQKEKIPGMPDFFPNHKALLDL